MSENNFVLDLTQPMRGQVAADKKFVADRYARPAGAGFGISSTLAGGARIEKASVGVSVSQRPLSPASIAQMRANHADLPQNLIEDAQKPLLLSAASISLIVHPRNPLAPTVHMNYRYFEIIDSHEGKPLAWWFGGGCDLTPAYVFKEDAVHFHRTLRTACDAHGAALYPVFKRWCDEYFFLPHRDEARGLGGIFFDDLSAAPHACLPDADPSQRPSTPEAIFAFVRSCGDALLPAYLPILRRRADMAYTEDERRWQLLRRGRYVEFNLLHDRGTKFGLGAPGARVESILMSMPETARWEYCTEMGAEGTREGELLAVLRKPRDWLAP